MGTVATKVGLGLGKYEPSTVVQLLPRCEACGSPRSDVFATECANPECAQPLPAPPEPQHVEAAILLPAPLMFIARCFGQLGAWLFALARKVDDDPSL